MAFSFFGGRKDSDQEQSKKSASRIRFGRVLGYTHGFGIGERVRRLGNKLGHFAFMMALVFRSARLLPPAHPMLNAANIGRFGIRDVIATAANGLVLKRENTDQILVFGAVVMAVLLVLAQILIIAVYAMFSTAHASGTTYFNVPAPDQDIVFNFLRDVFGVSGIFGTLTTTSTGATLTTPIQAGFHAVMGFYSTAMMIIATIIVIYYVITTVGESARSGKPFGRMNTLWAPIRLVLALGLLVPLGSHLNAAQYMTLYVAKWGSGLAGQAWKVFTDAYSDSLTLAASKASPSVESLASAVFASQTCMEGFNLINSGSDTVAVVAEWRKHGRLKKVSPATYSELTQARADGATSITYAWKTNKDMGTSCGSVVMNLVPKDASSIKPVEAASNAISRLAEDKYIAVLSALVSSMESPAKKLAKKIDATGSGSSWMTNSNVTFDTIATEVATGMNTAQTTVNMFFKTRVNSASGLVSALVTKIQTEAATRGWGTAGAYFGVTSKIGFLITEALNRTTVPMVKEAPNGFSEEETSKKMGWWSCLFKNCNQISETDKLIRSVIASIPRVIEAATQKSNVASLTPLGMQRTEAEKMGVEASKASMFHKPILWLAKWQFGDASIKLTDLMDNPTMYSLPALVSIGGIILDGSSSVVKVYIISQLGAVGAAVMGVAGGFMLGGPATAVTGGIIGGIVGDILAAFASFLWIMIIIGLAAGIILFYVLPLLPFMYFFYSVVNWVIEVVEAFVSMPLFALAHLRIDGDGMPGSTAYNGYLTLFGVMLRPLLIIVGLIVSSLVFGGAVIFLNEIYREAIFAYRPDVGASIDFAQIGGFGLVIYLILYVYLIFLLANSSFKLIDMIPDKAMRWIGGSTPFTGDKPVELGGTTKMALAGYAALDQTNNAVSGGMSKLRGMTQGVTTNLSNRLAAQGTAGGGAGGPGTGSGPTGTPGGPGSGTP